VIPHQTLFQYQLDYVWSITLHEKIFTQNVTKVTFTFETSPNTKPKENKVGEAWCIISPPFKNVEGHVPVNPTKLHPHQRFIIWLQASSKQQNWNVRKLGSLV